MSWKARYFPLALLGFITTQATGQPTHPVDFDREIRPILSDACFSCHGPDEQKRMANLRLDTPDGGAYSKRGDYQIIVPGDSSKSRLFQRVSDPNKSKQMPPPGAAITLTPQQIALLKQWIDQGAKWESHWSFVAPKAENPPQPNNRKWVRNGIDAFVLARLEKEGLHPSPESDKETLLRRVTYDLTGLPPTPEEIKSFVADQSPDAYEKRVDQLLHLPRYGERMAMPWLDLARYADTHGYHIDSHREMWHWRDWVINAFNQNMPYDEFTIEQLAGDLLPNATVSQRVASGFNRNHMINFEGGAIPEEYQVEYVVDRVEATATTWMGLTVGCARCHDHKYDPIKQKEFYQLYAFFNNVSEKGLDGRVGNAEPYLQLPSAEQQARKQQLEQAITAHEKALPEAEISKQQSEWEAKQLQQLPQHSATSALLAHYEFDSNLSDASGHYRYGHVAKGDLTYSAGTVGKAADFDGQTEVRLERSPVLDRNTPFALAWWMKASAKPRMSLFQQMEDAKSRRGLEVYLDDFDLTAIQVRSPRLYLRLAQQWPQKAIEIRTKNRIVWKDDLSHVVVNYEGSGKAAGFHVYVDGQQAETEILQDSLTEPIQTKGTLEIGNEQYGIPYKGRLDDLRLYSRPITETEIGELEQGEPLRAVLHVLPEKRSAAERNWIRNYYLTNAAPAELRTAWSELKALRKNERELNQAIPTTMVMSELTKPRDTFLLGRGDYRNQKEKVVPGVPSVLPPLPKDAPLNRLTLAKWLVSPQNPLTARVAVNRFWQMYFGTGLVKTAENFGAQGEAPSHPELLDWLATEFVRQKWDIRAMQRMIVTSATYRQASRVTPELKERDPENRLLARGPRFRLSAEMIRDGALAMSGLLREQTGGTGVMPYQPAGLWEEIAFGDGFSAQTYQQGRGADLYRRSLYTFWKRTSPPPEMITFDAPDREKCTARRTITNTPLQALVLLNDPTYVEAARALAQRMLLQGGASEEARLEYGFRLATARKPAAQEVSILHEVLSAESEQYKKHEEEAQKLLKVGESPIDPKVNKLELAAWTTVASMMLNLDETVTKQ